MVKNAPANSGDIRDPGQSLGQEDPLEKGVATQSSSPLTTETGTVPQKDKRYWTNKTSRCPLQKVFLK